jgi:hypothetical protein
MPAKKATVKADAGEVRLVSRPLTPGERRRLCDLFDRARRAVERGALEQTQGGLEAAKGGGAAPAAPAADR